MRKILLFLVALFLFTSPSYAVTGLGFGVRAGIVSNYDNPALDNLPTLKKDWIKDMNMLGGHLKIGTLPIIDLEVSAEYFWQTKEVSIVLGSDTLNGEFKVENYSVNATAKYVFSTPVIKPYVGAGGGLHVVNYKFSTGDFGELNIPDTQTKPSYHFNAGALLDVPAFPLDVFAEGRYTSIQTEHKTTGFFTWMLGVTLNLP